MKQFLLLFLSLAGLAHGSPFLVCDPYPAALDSSTKPVSFIVTGIAQSPLSTPATINTDNTVQLHYDLANLGNGSYTVSASAVNVFGGVSPASDPFTFTKGVPATPTNLRIVP